MPVKVYAHVEWTNKWLGDITRGNLPRAIARSTVGPSMQLRVFSDVSASEGLRYTRMEPRALQDIARGISLV